MYGNSTESILSIISRAYFNNGFKLLAANISTTPSYRPTPRTTTTTVRTTTEQLRTSTSKLSKDNDKKDNDCPGVCVADRIADYCEAYLKTPNLCKSGTKCCVAKDQYMENPDLRILIGSQNVSKAPSKPQKSSISEKVSIRLCFKCFMSGFLLGANYGLIGLNNIFIQFLFLFFHFSTFRSHLNKQNYIQFNF